ncbi:MAG: DUF401 family protein [Smithellaceae bacterium]|nr:DUF401 family protein [Smithellaceae bacterium]
MELAGLAIAFTLIFVLRLRDFNYAATILIACLIIGLTSGKSLNIFPDVLRMTLTDTRTWDICAAVALITLLGYALKETGMIRKLIGNLRGFLPSRVLVALIPAIFGVLSMPGGALISAPFNEPEADRLGLAPEQRTFMNVWFRHVWYWASPISPSTLLAVSMAGLALRDFILVNVVLFFASWVVGFLFSRKFLRGNGEARDKERNYLATLQGISPIAAALILSFVGVPVWLAVATGIGLVFLVQQVSWGKILETLLKGISWDIVAAVFATLVFRYMLASTGQITILLREVISSGVPLMLLLILVPLLVGAISGTPAMGIGICFPLLLPIIPAPDIATVTIMFAGITSGYMASPLHLCLVLTNQYYKSSLKAVYTYLVPASFLLYAFALAYHLLLMYLRG